MTSFPWQNLILTAGTGMASLIGVAVGATLSSRNQRKHWTTDKQIDACKAIVVESTRAQIALQRLFSNGDTPDWSGWNESLALVWLTCPPEVASAARPMDELFWRYNYQIKSSQLASEEHWAQARDAMEEARLVFINVVRAHISGWKTPLADVPNARPPLPTLEESSQPAADRPST